MTGMRDLLMVPLDDVVANAFAHIRSRDQVTEVLDGVVPNNVPSVMAEQIDIRERFLYVIVPTRDEINDELGTFFNIVTYLVVQGRAQQRHVLKNLRDSHLNQMPTTGQVWQVELLH